MPRDYQIPVLKAFDRGVKRGVCVWHRRAGKDKVLLNLMVKKSYERRGNYYYYFPTMSQGRKILWNGMDRAGMPFLDHIPKPLVRRKNHQEMRIELTNGSALQIVGTDKLEVVGPNPVGCVFSEYSLQNPRGFDFVRPILAENDGWALFNYTPRGMNHGYELYQQALDNPDWFCELLTVDHTDAIPMEAIDADRRSGMSEELVQQEYYCSFEYGQEGAYYVRQIAVVRSDGRICDLPIHNLPVYTFWDLGTRDATSIWFAQQIGPWWHLIDYYENEGHDISHYADVLFKEKDYLYGGHFAPFDAGDRTGRVDTSTLIDRAAEVGLDMVALPRCQNLEHEVEMVRASFPRVRFDRDRCRQGIHCLTNYKKSWDDNKKCYSHLPVHDWACLAGETKVLTRFGTYQIMDLPKTGEVLTLCGWKTYRNPRITKTDARLVEVVFADGHTVKCTPDHLFLTDNGWRYAENLNRHSLIRSCSIPSLSISTVDYTGFGRRRGISLKAANTSIATFGKELLVKFQGAVISIIETIIRQTIDFQTLSAGQGADICLQPAVKATLKKPPTILQKMHVSKLRNGMGQKKAGYGIAGWQNELKLGQNGSVSRNPVLTAVELLICLFEKVARRKNSVQPHANLLRVEEVRKTEEKREVWCLTVPSVGHFCLENGAVVHNSHGADAYRTFAKALTLGLIRDARSIGTMTVDDLNRLEAQMRPPIMP